MSIEYGIRDLDEHYREFVAEMYDDRSVLKNDGFIKSNLSCLMMMLLDILKDQSDQIADLRKYIAETLIDYDKIKIGGTN